MEIIKNTIIQTLDTLCKETFNDFAALAIYKKASRTIHWEYAIGNQNNRYKHMIGRPGQDIAGLIIRHGKPLVLDALDPTLADKRVEYPIMLAENLLSTIAVPLQIEEQKIGVLLAGSRHIRSYSPLDIQQVKQVATELTKRIHSLPHA